MRVEVIKTFVKESPRKKHITYNSEVIISPGSVKTDSCTSITFINRGTANVYVFGDITIKPNESVSFTNDADCKITQNFNVRE